MVRRRSAALRDAAGVYHVASRLAQEGFAATVVHGPGGWADVLAGLPGSAATAAIAVRTAVCPSGFREEGAAVSCEWRVGRGAATAEYPGPFVALVDLGPAGGPTGVWVVPSGKIRKHLVSSDKPRPHRYHAPGEELAPHADDWDSIEDHLLGKNEPQRAWFDREDLRDRYGDGFVGTLDVEAARLLGVQNSITLRMADERFPAEDLADASALLSVLFRRWMEAKRRPGRE